MNQYFRAGQFQPDLLLQSIDGRIINPRKKARCDGQTELAFSEQ